MPYTPPSQQSPAASRPESPPRSRDGKATKSLPSSSPFHTGPRPNLPRSSSSTSYLHRHRRSPPNSQAQLSYTHSDLNTSIASSDSGSWVHAPHASLRQSPPPVNNLKIPTGTIISPPDSGNNSSDDEGLTMVQRGKKLNTLADLQAAISDIEKERENNPSWSEEEKKRARSALGLDTKVAESPVTLQLPSASGRPPLSKEARKISHSRSATETNIQLPRAHSYSPPEGSSDSDLDDDATGQKPKMLRKKSGELVRPALRPASARRRPSSMPGTPTFGKAVHFSSDLEHVRHFLQVDRPLAVSAETSPVEETFEDDSEYPFPDGSSTSTSNIKKQFELDIRLANFPADTVSRKSMPVRVERVNLSPNKKTLIGSVAVQNLAFHKTVIARFTFDHWKTTSEVMAEYGNNSQRQTADDDGLDRFSFNIQLSDQTNLESKTLFFCVRYAVNGQEFWDSNNSANFQVDFSKRQVSTKTENGRDSNEATRRLNGLPRSRSPQQSPSFRKNFDDFGLGFDSPWAAKDSLPRAKSELSMLDDSSTPLKFRSKASGNAFEDLPGRRQAKGAAQPLGNRYDFNKSLSAALTAASSALGDRSGLPSPSPAPVKASVPKAAPTWTPTASPAKVEPQPQPSASPSGLSYEELVEKYCFFGNGKTAPPKANATSSVGKAQVDGPTASKPDTPSPADSPSPDTVQAAVESVAERFSGSVSPSRSELSSRAASPSSFGYPYHQPLNNGFAASAAIRG